MIPLSEKKFHRTYEDGCQKQRLKIFLCKKAEMIKMTEAELNEMKARIGLNAFFERELLSVGDIENITVFVFAARRVFAGCLSMSLITK